VSITTEIQAAIKSFHEIILGGIPFLLRQNETAFLSFMCCVAAIDALAGYRYPTNNVRERFVKFIKDYFPAGYAQHAENLYLLRCRLLHNFSPAYFTLVHAQPSSHLQTSPIVGIGTVLSDDVFFNDLKQAALNFFGEVQTDVNRQVDMQNRLIDLTSGGAIYT
jgi:hypothetical protein